MLRKCPSTYVKGRGDGSKPVSFSLLEKERFLESKEKGASKRVEWSQIGIRRPVFTPRPAPAPSTGDSAGGTGISCGPIPTFFAACAGGCRDVVALTGITSTATQEAPSLTTPAPCAGAPWPCAQCGRSAPGSPPGPWRSCPASGSCNTAGR